MKFDQILCLVAAERGLSADPSERAHSALRRVGATVGDVRWLSPQCACDIAFAGIAGGAAQAAVRETLGATPADAVAVAPQRRRKSLLLADMESTVIENEMVDEMADIAGLGDRIAAVTASTMAGELDFAASLRERAAAFTGLSADILAAALGRVRISAGAAALVATMRRHGAHTVLVSGGFTCFAEPVGKALGFDEVVANTLAIDNGLITGEVRAPILDRGGKADALQRLVGERRLETADVLAVGDGANDLDMLDAAGLGVAYRAKPIVAAAASARIDHGDLRALLYLQGYTDDEIETPDEVSSISPR